MTVINFLRCPISPSFKRENKFATKKWDKNENIPVAKINAFLAQKTVYSLNRVSIREEILIVVLCGWIMLQKRRVEITKKSVPIFTKKLLTSEKGQVF